MVIAPAPVRLPDTAEWVRGVLEIRDQVVPLMDLRKRMGMQSSVEEIEEFCALMQQREQDHRDWLAELEASVRENRPFRLTTDPHQCKFGKWYDAYQPPNLTVEGLLKKFDAPHRAIHRLAVD